MTQLKDIVLDVLRTHTMRESHGEVGDKAPLGIFYCSMIGCSWECVGSRSWQSFREHLADVISDAASNPQLCLNNYHATPHMNCRIFNDGR